MSYDPFYYMGGEAWDYVELLLSLN